MNAKKLSILVLFFGIFTISMVNPRTYANAAGGDSGGGGEAATLNGRPALRDWVDTTVCRWQRSKNLIAEAKMLPELLTSIKETHSLFGQVLERLLKSGFNVCIINGPLKAVPTQDRDSVTEYADGMKQVAVRLGDSIFLSMPIYNEMDDLNKAGLWIHETLHSFLEMDTPMRNQKLRSTSMLIKDNFDKRIGYDDFQFNLSMNSVAIQYAFISAFDINRDHELEDILNDELALRISTSFGTTQDPNPIGSHQRITYALVWTSILNPGHFPAIDKVFNEQLYVDEGQIVETMKLGGDIVRDQYDYDKSYNFRWDLINKYRKSLSGYFLKLTLDSSPGNHHMIDSLIARAKIDNNVSDVLIRSLSNISNYLVVRGNEGNATYLFNINVCDKRFDASALIKLTQLTPLTDSANKMLKDGLKKCKK